MLPCRNIAIPINVIINVNHSNHDIVADPINGQLINENNACSEIIQNFIIKVYHHHLMVIIIIRQQQQQQQPDLIYLQLVVLVIYLV
mmetsp:Transcript_28564/g.23646  ORF Transcript_28564/g.23646 Transcript_28564/m.23646 type:complete len:87 (-) Transcript_28564:202-462(-)